MLITKADRLAGDEDLRLKHEKKRGSTQLEAPTLCRERKSMTQLHWEMGRGYFRRSFWMSFFFHLRGCAKCSSLVWKKEWVQNKMTGTTLSGPSLSQFRWRSFPSVQLISLLGQYHVCDRCCQPLWSNEDQGQVPVQPRWTVQYGRRILFDDAPYRHQLHNIL